MKRAFVIFALCAAVIAAMAQRLVADAPTEVAVGEEFRITYTIEVTEVDTVNEARIDSNKANAARNDSLPNASDFRVTGVVPRELQLVLGPMSGGHSQTSTEFNSGNRIRRFSKTYTYTYYVYPIDVGTYIWPAAQINVSGEIFTADQLCIKVKGTSSDVNHKLSFKGSRAVGSCISDSDLFIKVSASKRRVHEQEPIMLSYKVYTLVDLTSLDGKMPALKGFYTQEVQQPQEKSYKIETINGRQYRTVTFRKYVMFPQIAGKLKIPSITFDGILFMRNPNVDPFEAFFNGGKAYVEVKKKVKAPGLTIQVDPLPARPARFSVGVGTFTISAQLNKADVEVNNPVTLKVIVSGRGNLKQIKMPEVKLPNDFVSCDAKVSDSTTISANGMEGMMVYDFCVKPRNQGKYVIPPIEFIYYDISADMYKTIKTSSFELNVTNAASSAQVGRRIGDKRL